MEGLLYQYNDGVYSTRRGEYDDWFLSGGVKYDFTEKPGRPARLQPVDPAPRLRQSRRRRFGERRHPDRHRAEPAAEARALHQVLREPAVFPGAVRLRRRVLLQAGHEGHAGDRHHRESRGRGLQSRRLRRVTPSAARRTCRAPAPTRATRSSTASR